MKTLLPILICIMRLTAFAEMPTALEFLKRPCGDLTDAQRVLIVDHCIKSGEWKDIADALVAGITPAIRGGDVIKPGLVEKLRLAQILFWLGNGRHEGVLATEAGKGVSGKSGNLYASVTEESLRAILCQRELVDSLGDSVMPSDNLTGVFAVLADLLEKNPKVMSEYPNLAVACAIVFDQPPPSRWPPICYCSRDLAPVIEKGWVASCAYFMEQAGKKDIANRLRNLKASELKFVVDAHLDPSEFRWALKNVHLAKEDIGEAFFMVKYDKTRLKRTEAGNRDSDWIHKEYTLASIIKNGGLCGDQAYFAWVVGKAYVVPTIFFTGTGKEGGHAWVGFLEHKNTWSIDSGRYTSQRFITGSAMDPQTWSPITDHELQFMTSRTMMNQKFINSSLMLTLAQLLPDNKSSERMQLVADAGRECPANYQVWLFKERQLLLANNTKELKELYQGMAVQFKNVPDMRSYAQSRLSEVFRKSGDSTAADQIEKKMVTHNKNDRVDISIAAACNMIQDKIKSGAAEDAFRLYRKSMQAFRNDPGLLSTDLIAPVVLAFRDAGEMQLVEKALAAACRELTPSTLGSIEDTIVRVGRSVGVNIKAQKPNKYGGRTLEVDSIARSKAAPKTSAKSVN